jgi:hypothetical protein
LQKALASPPSLPSAVTLRTSAVVLLALASLIFWKLALPAALFVLLSWLSVPREPKLLARRYGYAHALAAVLAAVSVLLFLAREAVPGIVQGGTSAAGGRAVSRLREILFAEDNARKKAVWDPDGDGVGSALLLAELTGEIGVRRGAWLSPPLLEGYPKVDVTRAGPSLEIGGFWFMVCLPTGAGGFSSEPASRFDDELAERRFVAYAWPSGRAPGLTRAYFLDEHERILSAPSRAGLRRGTDHPPSCDDALSPATNGAWRPWRDKKPRESLPGSR